MARIDTLTAEEELELEELDRRTLMAERCMLQVSERVVHDEGVDSGYCAGRVVRLGEDDRIHIKFERAEDQEKVRACPESW